MVMMMVLLMMMMVLVNMIKIIDKDVWTDLLPEKVDDDVVDDDDDDDDDDDVDDVGADKYDDDDPLPFLLYQPLAIDQDRPHYQSLCHKNIMAMPLVINFDLIILSHV